MTDLAERGSLGIRELQPPLQLCFQDAVFGGQIFISQQQLLVHRPGDVGQDARPIHSSSDSPSAPIKLSRTSSPAPSGEATPEGDKSPPFLQFQFFDLAGSTRKSFPLARRARAAATSASKAPLMSRY